MWAKIESVKYRPKPKVWGYQSKASWKNSVTGCHPRWNLPWKQHVFACLALTDATKGYGQNYKDYKVVQPELSLGLATKSDLVI